VNICIFSFHIVMHIRHVNQEIFIFWTFYSSLLEIMGHLDTPIRQKKVHHVTEVQLRCITTSAYWQFLL
jgi:hypothetical protein